MNKKITFTSPTKTRNYQQQNDDDDEQLSSITDRLISHHDNHDLGNSHEISTENNSPIIISTNNSSSPISSSSTADDYKIFIETTPNLKTTNTSHSLMKQQQKNNEQHHKSSNNNSNSSNIIPQIQQNSDSNISTALMFIFSMIIIFICIYYFSNNLVTFLEFVKDLGTLGNLILAFAYLPTGIPLAIFSYYIPLTVSSGFIYGFINGFITVAIGSAISASFGFWITRKLTLKWFETKIEASSKLTSVRNLLEQHPKKIIFFIRLLPIPFGLQNGLCAVTRISYTTFIYSSVIGLLPENLILSYIGSKLPDITSSNQHNTISSYQQNLLIGAIVIGIILSLIARKVLQSSSVQLPITATTSTTNLFQNSTISITSNETQVLSPNQKQIDTNRDIILVIKSTTSSQMVGDNNNNSNSDGSDDSDEKISSIGSGHHTIDHHQIK